MNDRSIDVSSYSIYDTAVATVKSFVDSINTGKSTLATQKSELSKESVFMGPICDSCVAGFGKVDSILSTAISNCNQVSELIKTASTGYQSSDNNAANNVIGNGASNSSVANAAVEWAKSIAADDRYGYVNGGMGKNGYDCTQLMHAAYEAAGLSLPEKGNVNNENIVDYYTKNGFTWVPGPIDPSTLEAGDVLVNKAHHAEMYIGNGQKVGAHSNYDGARGDSSGNEISIDDYKEFSNGGWDGYLRYIGT